MGSVILLPQYVPKAKVGLRTAARVVGAQDLLEITDLFRLHRYVIIIIILYCNIKMVILLLLTIYIAPYVLRVLQARLQNKN